METRKDNLFVDLGLNGSTKMSYTLGMAGLSCFKPVVLGLSRRVKVPWQRWLTLTLKLLNENMWFSSIHISENSLGQFVQSTMFIS